MQWGQYMGYVGAYDHKKNITHKFTAQLLPHYSRTKERRHPSDSYVIPRFIAVTLVNRVQSGRSVGGESVQRRVRSTIGHSSVSLVKNLNIEVITPLKDYSLQLPPTVYLEVS